MVVEEVDGWMVDNDAWVRVRVRRRHDNDAKCKAKGRSSIGMVAGG